MRNFRLKYCFSVIIAIDSQKNRCEIGRTSVCAKVADFFVTAKIKKQGRDARHNCLGIYISPCYMIKEGQITLNPQHFTTALNSSDKLLPNYRVLSVGFPYRCKGSNIIFSGKTIKIFSDSWHNASKCEYLLS